MLTERNNPAVFKISHDKLIVPSALVDTLEWLTAVENKAALDVLRAAYESPQQSLRMAALRCLMQRPETEVALHITAGLHRVGEAGWRLLRVSRFRLNDAIPSSLSAGDDQTFLNACTAAVVLEEYETAKAIVPHLFQSRRVETAAQALFGLALTLQDLLEKRRFDRLRRDLLSLQGQMVRALEDAAAGFARHRRPEIIEALLMCANRECRVVHNLLQNEGNTGAAETLSILQESQRPSIMRLLASFLDSSFPPKAACRVIGQRRDAAFLNVLLERVGRTPVEDWGAQLRRLDQLPWLEQPQHVLAGLSDAQAATAVRLTQYAEVDDEALERVACFARHGGPATRLAAIAALKQIAGEEVDFELIESLGDDVPRVRAAAVQALYERDPQRHLTLLLGLMDDRSPEVEQAVRDCLQGLTMRQLLQNFGQLDCGSAASLSWLAFRMDPDARIALHAALTSPARNKRLRAAEIVRCGGMVDAMLEEMLQLADDDEHMIRRLSIESLAGSSSPAAAARVRQALTDPSDIVREAARQACERRVESVRLGA